MTLDFISTLFPAIPLAIVALNLRYTSLAGLMRNLAAQIETPNQGPALTDILVKELQMMQVRITLVKYALFFAGASFVFNLGTLYLTLYNFEVFARLALGATILLMMVALICFCVETILSTRALNLHLGVLAPSLLHSGSAPASAPDRVK